MAHRVSRFALAFFLATTLHAQLPKFPGLPGGASSSSNLSEAQIGSGIKDALSVGTQKAVTNVAHPGGYLENQAIRILLPKNLQPVDKALRAAGQGPKVDEFVASMNHAAEEAAPEAGKIFGAAVRQMTIDDARKLLTGGDTSITTYFKDKTSAELTAAFRPHVEAAMKKNGVTQQYQALTSSAPKLPFMKSESMDINAYVVNKALEGLFYMLAQQEKEIRTNPAARTTALLKQVFGGK
jgi:predicted metalloendopeptidase